MTQQGEAVMAQCLAVIAGQLAVLSATLLDTKGREMQKTQLEQLEKNVAILVGRITPQNTYVGSRPTTGVESQ